MTMNDNACLTCARRLGRDILAAAGLSDDLWACEAMLDDSGVTIYHVARWSEVLGTNERCVARGQSPEFSPFALCRTREAALEACERMRAKQRALRLLGVPADEEARTSCEACEATL